MIKQQLMIEGMDKLLGKFNKYPDDKGFTVKEIIQASNEVCDEILKSDWHISIFRQKEGESMGQITELIQEAHATAVKHGWWEEPPDFGTLIALCHSELSEALEEYRDGHSPEEVREQHQVSRSRPRKPEGIPSELADTVIRIFDMCGYYGIELEDAVLRKMKYNKSRPYKHGGKVI